MLIFFPLNWFIYLNKPFQTEGSMIWLKRGELPCTFSAQLR